MGSLTTRVAFRKGFGRNHIMRTSTTSTTGPRAVGFASIWRLAWPQILTMFLYFLIGLADVYVAGLLGREVQASMGMLTQAMFFFMVDWPKLSLPAGEVVVLAPKGVELERWMPVFM